MKRSMPSTSSGPSAKFVRWAPETRPVAGDPETVGSVRASIGITRAPATAGFSLNNIPDDHFHLGDQLFASVSIFKECVKVHVREYVMEGELYRPSKKGVVFTAYGWQTWADKMNSFHYRRRNKVLVIPNEMMMTSVMEDRQVTAVRLQRMFVKADGALQFYPEIVTMTLDQMDQLLLSREYITSTVKSKLFGTVLQKAIRAESTRRSMISEGEPLNTLAIIIKCQTEDHINDLITCSGCDMDCSNQLGHECLMKNNSARARECFIRALFKTDIFVVAREFAQKNLILNDFDPEALTELVKNLYVEGDICCICKEEIFAKRILTCNHAFCMNCTDRWLETNDTCPTCRVKIL